MKRIVLYFSFAVVALTALAQTNETKIIAHRGFWKAANGAQNSIEALACADTLGVYGSEFDVWYTADGNFVVNHDPKVNGIDMRTAPVDSITSITLKNGEQLPTLDAYLTAAQKHPGLRLILEMKPLPDISREDKGAELIVDKLKYYGLLDRTDIISFSLNACLAFVKLGMPVYYLDGDLTPRKVRELGMAGIDYNGRTLDAHPEWVEKAHQEGLKVNVWTIDDPERIQHYIDMGVDFITTNNPLIAPLDK